MTRRRRRQQQTEKKNMKRNAECRQLWSEKIKQNARTFFSSLHGINNIQHHCRRCHGIVYVRSTCSFATCQTSASSSTAAVSRSMVELTLNCFRSFFKLRRDLITLEQRKWSHNDQLSITSRSYNSGCDARCDTPSQRGRYIYVVRISTSSLFA